MEVSFFYLFSKKYKISINLDLYSRIHRVIIV